MPQMVWVIGSDRGYTAQLQQHIQTNMGLDCRCYASSEEALRHLVNAVEAQPDVILCEIATDSFAMDTVRALRSFRNDVQVIALLQHQQLDLALSVQACGASDFLLTPCHAAQLTSAIRNALLRRDLQIEARQAYPKFCLSIEEMQPHSNALSAALYLIRNMARSNAAVLLEGAPGTGHEMFARALHLASAQRERPFVAVNASVLYPGEVEYEFFGNSHAPGLMHEVGEGILFIHNFDTLPQPLWSKFQRIATGEVPICETFSKARFAGRLVLGINNTARQAGGWQNKEMGNLLSALDALPVSLPYLRDMPEDIAMFAQLHCNRFAMIEGKAITGISPNALQMLREISWPGNMEQLAQGIFNAVMCCQGSELQVEDFRYLFRPQSASVSSLPHKRQANAGQAEPPSQLEGLFTCVDESGNVKRLQEVEQEIIHYALERYSGHMSNVARHLGIGRSTLYRKISAMDGK